MALFRNYDFEYAPPFTAAQTGDGWVDGTATGSTTNANSGWWSSPRAAAVAVQFDTAQFHSGLQSLKLSTTNTTGRARVYSVPASGGTITGSSSPYHIPALPSTSYTLSAWVKTNNVASASTGIQLIEINSAFAVGVSNTSSTLTGTNGWTYLTLTITTAATCTYLAINLFIDTAGNISDAWFDDLILSGPGIGPGQVIGRPFRAGLPLVVWRDRLRVRDYTVAGGAALTKTLADTATPSDTLSKAISAPKTDSSTPSDAIIKTPKPVFADSSTPTDALIKAIKPAFSDSTSSTDVFRQSDTHVIGDTVTPSDTLGHTATFQRTLADTVTSSDALAKTVTSSRSDTTTPADAVSKAPHIFETDSTSASDGLHSADTHVLGDSVTATDVITLIVTYLRSLTDTVTTSEAVVKSPTVNKTDTSTPTDSATPTLTITGAALTQSLADTVTPSDSLATTSTFHRLLGDSTHIFDTPSFPGLVGVIIYPHTIITIYGGVIIQLNSNTYLPLRRR